jgi:hypothetical protein
MAPGWIPPRLHKQARPYSDPAAQVAYRTLIGKTDRHSGNSAFQASNYAEWWAGSRSVWSGSTGAINAHHPASEVTTVCTTSW